MNDDRDTRLNQLAKDWRDENGGAHARVSRDVVFEIAFRLIREGIQPTIEAIRRVNAGKGSPNVIHPLLVEFYDSRELEKRWMAPQPSDALHEPMQRLWADVLTEARSVVARDSARQLQKIETLREQAEAFQASLLDRERLFDAREDGLRGEIAALNRHLVEARTANAAELTRVEESSSRMKVEHAASLEDLQRSLAVLESIKTELVESNAGLRLSLEIALLQLRRAEAEAVSLESSLRAAVDQKEIASAERDRLAGQLQATLDHAEAIEQRQEREIALTRSALETLRIESSGRVEKVLRELAEERAERTRSAAELVAAHARNKDLVEQRSDLRNALQVRDRAAVVLTDQLEAERSLRLRAEAMLKDTPNADERATR